MNWLDRYRENKRKAHQQRKEADYERFNGLFTHYYYSEKPIVKTPLYSKDQVVGYFQAHNYDFAEDVLEYFTKAQTFFPETEGHELLIVPSFRYIDMAWGDIGFRDGRILVLDFALGSGGYFAKKINATTSSIGNFTHEGYEEICEGMEWLVDNIANGEFNFGQKIQPRRR